MITASFFQDLWRSILSEKNSNKIKQYRKPLNINLGMVFFGVIFIYLVVCVFMYFTTKHISGYQVKKGSLFVDNVYTGLAIRKEQIINSAYSGYINYYVREGSRIGAYKMVCTVDEGGRLQDLMEEQSMGENTLSESALHEIRDDIMNFTLDFEERNFFTAYDFMYSIQGSVLEQANNNVLNNLDLLNRSGESGLINICNAPGSGIVVYSHDGYEDFSPNAITEEILNREGYEKTQLISNNLVSTGDPIYKLITDEEWSIMIHTDPERAEYLVEKEYVQVKFLKDQNVSWAEVRLITNGEGEHFIQLVFNNSMISYCNERFIDIELIIEEEEGLKVPNSAIITKEFLLIPEEYITKSGNNGEDGVLKQVYDENGNPSQKFIQVTIYNKEKNKYYVDGVDLEMGDTLLKLDSSNEHQISEKGSLVGVFNKNKGYADFKQIKVLYENEEYSIIKSNTEYGLIEYDYIVLDAEAVSEDELLR